MSKEEFVSRFIGDRAARNKRRIREADEYHMAAVGKQKKIKRRIKAQRAF